MYDIFAFPLRHMSLNTKTTHPMKTTFRQLPIRLLWKKFLLHSNGILYFNWIFQLHIILCILVLHLPLLLHIALLNIPPLPLKCLFQYTFSYLQKHPLGLILLYHSPLNVPSSSFAASLHSSLLPSVSFPISLQIFPDFVRRNCFSAEWIKAKNNYQDDLTKL